MIHRYELVTQWQERLAAAQELAQSTARFRWIHLARVRLYRFLLTCYGRGQWRTGDADTDRSPSASMAAGCESSSWAGKPPKSAGAIQSVLKSVHNAQDRPPPVGPLAGGLDPDTYLAVTSSDARIDVEKCEDFLIGRGFHPRVIGRGRRRTVEVPYAELKAAEALVDAHREMLRPMLITRADKLRQYPVLPEETQMLVVGLILIAPLAGLGALALGAALLKDQLNSGTAIGLFLSAFVAVVEVSVLWYFFGPHLRECHPLGRRRMIAQAVFWGGVGISISLIMAAWFIENWNDPALRAVLFSNHALAAALISVAAVVITMAIEWVFRRQRRPKPGRVPTGKSPAAEAGDEPAPCSAAAAARETSSDK